MGVGEKHLRERENIDWLLPYTCPNQGLNPQTFGVWDDTPTN